MAKYDPLNIRNGIEPGGKPSASSADEKAKNTEQATDGKPGDEKQKSEREAKKAKEDFENWWGDFGPGEWGLTFAPMVFGQREKADFTKTHRKPGFHPFVDFAGDPRQQNPSLWPDWVVNGFSKFTCLDPNRWSVKTLGARYYNLSRSVRNDIYFTQISKGRVPVVGCDPKDHSLYIIGFKDASDKEKKRIAEIIVRNHIDHRMNIVKANDDGTKTITKNYTIKLTTENEELVKLVEEAVRKEALKNPEAKNLEVVPNRIPKGANSFFGRRQRRRQQKQRQEQRQRGVPGATP